jgi:hypothetical protein
MTMLNYVAAIATAVTLMISPVASGAKEADTARKKPQPAWAPYADSQSIEIQKKIEVSSARSSRYVLSTVEQGIFRKALLQSVRVISGGKTAA